jgi:hypothetical protein
MNLEQVAKEYQESAANATHLLLIAQTHMGKTDYVAQAAIDGWEILYIDADNGLKTLMAVLRDNPEALRRVHYFNPANIMEFTTELIETKIELRYDSEFRDFRNSTNMSKNGTVSLINPLRISKNVIVVLDSWTSLAFSSIVNKAAKTGFDLADAERYTREIYGGTGFKLTQIAKAIQASPFNWIVHAHPAVYERKEKPAGKIAEDIDEKDMIIKETTLIPASTSGPHGFSIGKYFNEIGWMEVDRVGNRKLDFKVVKDRIGGGSTVNGIADPRGPYRFSTLFGKPPVVEPTGWLVEMSADEYRAIAAAKYASAPKLTSAGVTKPAAAPAVSIAPQSATQAPKPGGVAALLAMQKKG